MNHRMLIPVFVVATLVVGCTTTTYKVNPGEHDHGFRYYRPKPYLFIQPAGSDTGLNAPEFVSIEMKMLPDFNEQVSIRTRAGIGVNKTNLEITEGWNLTKITQELDSQTDENIKAIGGLIKSASALVPTGAGVATKGARTDVAYVAARNVPLGFYESVITRDDCGVKRLAGFRYIGFMPYATCPVNACGGQTQSCHDGELYGLVNENGITVFRLLPEIATSSIAVKPPKLLSVTEFQKQLDIIASARKEMFGEFLSPDNIVLRMVASAQGTQAVIVTITLAKKELDEVQNRLKERVILYFREDLKMKAVPITVTIVAPE
jgi:hypothetical protein